MLKIQIIKKFSIPINDVNTTMFEELIYNEEASVNICKYSNYRKEGDRYLIEFDYKSRKKILNKLSDLKSIITEMKANAEDKQSQYYINLEMMFLYNDYLRGLFVKYSEFFSR